MKAARYLNWRINREVNAEDTELINFVQEGMETSAYSLVRLLSQKYVLSIAQKRLEMQFLYRA